MLSGRQAHVGARGGFGSVLADRQYTPKYIVVAFEMLGRERAEHATERERLEERTRLAEQRFIDMDRERTASLKLQKALENESVLRMINRMSSCVRNTGLSSERSPNYVNSLGRYKTPQHH